MKKPKKAGGLIKTDRRREDGTKPKHRPTMETRGLVKLAYAVKIPQSEIADAMDISLSCLQRNYAKEMREARLFLQVEILNAYVKLVRQGNPNAITFGMKSIVGVEEKNSVEHTVQELPKLVINVGKPKSSNDNEDK